MKEVFEFEFYFCNLWNLALPYLNQVQQIIITDLYFKSPKIVKYMINVLSFFLFFLFLFPQKKRNGL
jgi:hypothetical protein